MFFDSPRLNSEPRNGTFTDSQFKIMVTAPTVTEKATASNAAPSTSRPSFAAHATADATPTWTAVRTPAVIMSLIVAP